MVVSIHYAREVSFIMEGDEIIVCNIYVYSITAIRKLHSNQMLYEERFSRHPLSLSLFHYTRSTI